jgi:uncharacterized membrane protein
VVLMMEGWHRFLFTGKAFDSFQQCLLSAFSIHLPFCLSRRQFDEVKDGLWQFLIIMTVFTFVPSLAFVLAEIFRETKPDGSNEEKSRAENTAEGVSLLLLVVGWVPAIMMATTPGGPASLVSIPPVGKTAF